MNSDPGTRQELPAASNAAMPDWLVGDIRTLIDAVRDRVAQTINSELVLLYWGICDRIRRDILQQERMASKRSDEFVGITRLLPSFVDKRL